ncbi:hypothetical protein C2845_PM17G09040 [Panicum miliaceum]|uniref:Uncharacterized protein n=1 Tax=Panicum miliaceum TaxID=4540 RepID=A0A3L6Q0W9_PANMI|nr:hypothetical protein C2845_PM17G09040 [Panicum miliaceum]
MVITKTASPIPSQQVHQAFNNSLPHQQATMEVFTKATWGSTCKRCQVLLCDLRQLVRLLARSFFDSPPAMHRRRQCSAEAPPSCYGPSYSLSPVTARRLNTRTIRSRARRMLRTL